MHNQIIASLSPMAVGVSLSLDKNSSASAVCSPLLLSSLISAATKLSPLQIDIQKERKTLSTPAEFKITIHSTTSFPAIEGLRRLVRVFQDSNSLLYANNGRTVFNNAVLKVLSLDNESEEEPPKSYTFRKATDSPSPKSSAVIPSEALPEKSSGRPAFSSDSTQTVEHVSMASRKSLIASQLKIHGGKPLVLKAPKEALNIKSIPKLGLSLSPFVNIDPSASRKNSSSSLDRKSLHSNPSRSFNRQSRSVASSRSSSASSVLTEEEVPLPKYHRKTSASILSASILSSASKRRSSAYTLEESEASAGGWSWLWGGDESSDKSSVVIKNRKKR
jgi:hypothetical protein